MLGEENQTRPQFIDELTTTLDKTLVLQVFISMRYSTSETASRKKLRTYGEIFAKGPFLV